MASVTEQQGQIAGAYQAGRRMGFAVSALALGLVAGTAGPTGASR